MKSSVLLYRSLLLASLLLTAPAFAADNTVGASGNNSLAAESAKPAPFTLEIRNGSIIEDGKPAVPATVGNILEYVKKHNAPFDLALGSGVANVTVGDMIMHLNSPSSMPPADSGETREGYEASKLCAAITSSASVPLTEQNIGNGFALRLISPDLQVQVFNLANYLNPNGSTQPADKDVQASVQEKLAALREIILNTLSNLNPNAPSAPTVKFQFHEGANLLVVTGDEQAIDVTKKVVDALTRPTVNVARQGGFIPPDAVTAWASYVNDNTQTNADKMAAYLNALGKTDPAQAVAALTWSNAVPNRQSADAAIQAAIAALNRAQAQVAQNPEQLKQLQQRIAELDKLMAELNRQIPPASKNNGASSSTPGNPPAANPQ
ncbi:MAG TPA: hypothetical protein VHC95_07290 [Opitutales bacterium]|nr:hypothetical protein [Opitutales bacterium]